MEQAANAAQGWEAYGVVFVAMVVATLLPLALMLSVRRPAGPKSSKTPPETLKAPAIGIAQSINTRYFTATQVGALLFAPFLLLLPLAGHGGVVPALGVLSVCTTAGCALIYSNRKGDLRWLSRAGNEESKE